MGIRSFEFKGMTGDIAYIIGTYLGHGSISDDGSNKTFQLKSFDLEYCEEVHSALERTLEGDGGRIVAIEPETKKEKKHYVVICMSNDLCNFIQGEVGCKDDFVDLTELPQLINDNKFYQKRMIEGYLDGDGFVQMTKTPPNFPYAGEFRYLVGFCCTNTWHDELNKMMRRNNIIFDKPPVEATVRGKQAYRYQGKADVFVDGNIKFASKRKQDRLISFTNCPYEALKKGKPKEVASKIKNPKHMDRHDRRWLKDERAARKLQIREERLKLLKSEVESNDKFKYLKDLSDKVDSYIPRIKSPETNTQNTFDCEDRVQTCEIIAR